MLLPLKDENPTRRAPLVTVGILLVNVAAFVYARLLGPTGFDVLTASLGLIPFEVTRGVDAISPTPIPLYGTLLTTMFLHGGWVHLGGNMLYLWIFGNNVEDLLGHGRFLLFYLFCGLAATAAHVVSAPESTVPLVGASGAIAGVLGAYTAVFPRARIHVLMWVIFFVQVIRVPAVIVLGVWFLMQIMNASMDPGHSGGVAWYAHIAGFIAGYLVVRRRSRRQRSARFSYVS